MLGKDVDGAGYTIWDANGRVRVTYYHPSSTHQIRMILICRKGIMDTLTDEQKAQLRAIKKGWK